MQSFFDGLTGLLDGLMFPGTIFSGLWLCLSALSLPVLVAKVCQYFVLTFDLNPPRWAKYPIITLTLLAMAWFFQAGNLLADIHCQRVRHERCTDDYDN